MFSFSELELNWDYITSLHLLLPNQDLVKHILHQYRNHSTIWSIACHQLGLASSFWSKCRDRITGTWSEQRLVKSLKTSCDQHCLAYHQAASSPHNDVYLTTLLSLAIGNLIDADSQIRCHHAQVWMNVAPTGFIVASHILSCKKSAAQHSLYHLTNPRYCFPLIFKPVDHTNSLIRSSYVNCANTFVCNRISNKLWTCISRGT